MMEIGPEIKIHGKRPDWLKDNEMIGIVWRNDVRWDNLDTPACCVYGWEDSVTHIMLSADHPYYRGALSENPMPTPITAKEAHDRFYEIWDKTAHIAGDAAAELLRELGMTREDAREETPLDRYFAANPMTASERDAVTAYAAWAEENAE